MKVLILDGMVDGALAETIERAARGRGAEVARTVLSTLTLAPCQGEFDCWVKTPGECRAHDDQRALVQAVHDADLVVYVSTLAFGSFGSTLKLAVDRFLPLLQPFFAKDRRDGLTHHHPRYGRCPAMLLVGWDEAPSEERRRIFAALAAGNALNLSAPWFKAVVLSAQDGDRQGVLERAVDDALARGATEPAAPEDVRAVLGAVCTPRGAALTRPVKIATLLVGSPRPKGQSTSESLGRRLLEPLVAAGVETRVVHAVSFVKPGRAASEALATMRDSDLLVVSSPLYVDALPALATRALEQLAPAGARLSSVVGVVNCGFPEAAHTRTAMRVIRAFCEETGRTWAGGLAMGGGEAVHGKPLAEVGGLVRHQLRALDEAGRALAAGQTIPPEAVALMQTQLLPPVLYRWIGELSWLSQGRKHQLWPRALRARPLDASVGA